jgi:MFS family permease
MFSALRVRNFRLFMLGQLVSLSGTWMQTVAVPLLVLQLGGKGGAVGLTFSLQYLPLLVLGPIGGVIADRVDNRLALCCTGAAYALITLTLAMIVATDVVQLWMVYALAAGLGVVTAVDLPVRQTFVYVMTGPEEVTNAVSINAIMSSMARVIGPALGGILIAVVGLAACFFYNAASFVAVIVGLVFIRSNELHAHARASRAEARIRDGLRYVRATPALFFPLVMAAIVGVFSREEPVSLPLIAEFTFRGGAGLFAAMMALFSVGAILGGLFLAQAQPSPRTLVVAGVGLGLAMLGAAVAPNEVLVLIAMVPMGVFAIYATVGLQSHLQLSTESAMRGRVMALFSMAFIGSSAIGGPIIGWSGDHLGPRWGLGVGAIAAIVAAGLGYAALIRPSLPAAERPQTGADIQSTVS